MNIAQAALRPELERLKAAGFNVLVDLTAVDYLNKGTPQRFQLVYRLMDLDADTGLVRSRLELSCWIEDEKGPPSAKDLWPNADWLEREVWDMFGVPFRDRPGIKRILLYEEFSGHPLRKDYPINKRQPLIGPKEDAPRDRMLEGDLRPKLA